MNTVYLSPLGLQIRPEIISLLEENLFNPVILDQDDLPASYDQNSIAGIFVSAWSEKERLYHMIQEIPSEISILFVFYQYDPELSEFMPDRPRYDFLIPPFEDEDIVSAFNRQRKGFRGDDEICELKKELGLRQKMIKVYHELTRSLTSTLSMKQLLAKVTEKGDRLLQCAALSIYLYNSQTTCLDYMTTGKKKRIKPNQKNFNLGEGIPGRIFQSGKSLVANKPFNETISDEIKDHYAIDIHGICCVLLEFKNRYLGVVEAINKNNGAPFDEQDLVVMQILADHAAIAIENSSLYEKVKQLTIVDDLTQLNNYRFFNLMLTREFKRAERFLSPLSLLFLDLDGFKQVNDHYGHLVGSQVLKDVASLITETVRNIDIVSRFGGDEFTVILPNTGYDGAEQVARRILENIEAYKHPKPDWDIQLSVSIGISSYPEHVQTNDQLLKVADKAMYKIKENRKKETSIGTLSHQDIQRLQKKMR
ncbi:diguanylate cyclase [candidate division CSSED10-310 bacterium]|uniref:Diguanylate cyclase n=1 Tax=candidate division CSSED10-310 bacterium TaxID=2855610 RepID=A0ABV6YR05_UNCC1